MLGGTPDPRFHPRKARGCTAATVAILALAIPATAGAVQSDPLSGYKHKQNHRIHHHPNPLSGYQKLY